MPEEPSTDDEQISEEGGDIEDSSKEEITTVTDSAEDQDEVETDIPDEEQTPDDEKDDEEVAGDDKILSSAPMALSPSELKVEAMEPGEGDALVALTSAEIVYTNGCVSGDGKLRKDADITFKLLPKAGKKLGTIQYKTKGTAEGATESEAKDVTFDNGVYKIEKANLVDVNVTIIVNTAGIEYTLKSADDTDYKLYLTTTNDDKQTVIDNKKEIAASTGLVDKIAYDKRTDEVSFAAVANTAGTKIRSVTVQAGDGEPKVLESKANTEDTTPAPIYTFKPSELVGIAENEDQPITITVETFEAAEINITKNVGTGATVGTVADADAAYDAGTYVDAGSATQAKEGQKVIFTVTMDENYKALVDGDVTATLDGESIKVAKAAEQTKGEDSDKKTIPEHYIIDLAAANKDSKALVINVKTDLKDEVARKVKFESLSENSIITENGDASGDALNGTTVKVAPDADYKFDVTAKPGYQIYSITATYTKKYTKVDGQETPADAAETVSLAKDKVQDTNPLKKEAEVKNIAVPFSGSDTIGEDSRAWTTTDVTIKVYAMMDAAEKDKTVTFSSAYDYEVTTSDKIVSEEDNVYNVKEGAEIFAFTVDAVTKPIVEAKVDGKSILLNEEPEKTEAGYVYQIVAGALADDQTITITRDKFDIAVDYDHDNIRAEVFKGNSKVTGVATDDTTDTYANKDADYAYKFIIELENDNTKITKVSYTVGEAEEATEVKAKGGSYVFSVDLTGDVEVNVETADEYDLVVTENDEVVSPDKNKVYNVGHASTVTAQLLNGSEAAPLLNAEVKDGAAVAATIAEVGADNLVTLKFDASEYNKVLTVVLSLTDKTTREFKVKTTAAAAEVSLTGVKNGKVDIPVDTKASYKLTVKTKNATLDGIGVRVVPADDEKKEDNAAITAANNAVSAEINDEGYLVIKAAPAMEGAESVAKVIIVDESNLTDAQKNALNVDNALKGGVVTVNTSNATIVGKAPTVKSISATDKKIKVQLGVPKGVVDPEVGEIYYKVELTAPETLAFPEGTSDADKTAITNAVNAAVAAWNTTDDLYQAKSDIDDANGLLEIQVISDTVAKGVLLQGFKVKVTLMQTTTADALSGTTLATTIEGGNYELANLATKNPYYEVKLGLKKGTTTLITGQNKNVTVATPNFNKLTSYSTVQVDFVNTSTGEIIGAYDESEGYAEYAGMYAAYDELSNAVIVNAVDATYNNNVRDYYKNLGVKVTAYAEESAYGAVATQKLTVVNGIEDINPDAPTYVYKADKKAASFKVTVDLNGTSENKKNAPKSKKVDYKIVATDGTEASLSSAIRSNVTVKNGKVTIAKGYIVAPRAVDNQFQVKVTAMDYANNGRVEYTDTITITDEGLQMGDIAVFDAYDSIKGATTATIEATRKNYEYQVHVLNPGVKTTKKSYTSDDYVDSSLLTFKSSNAKSVSIDASGRLTILKAAKNVKITAIPKDGSNPKPVKTLTLTVGQDASATPLLKITRYEDSTLSTQTPMNADGEKTITYNGNSTNNYFKLEVVKAVTEDDVTTYDPFYLANYSISYKGAKKVSQNTSYNGDVITIVANAKETTITLKDKAVKNSTPVVYKLTNNSFVDAKVTTPKIATTEKLTQNDGAWERYYTVKGGKNDDFTGKYVMLSIDQTKKNPSDIADVFTDEYEDEIYLDKPLPIQLGKGFDLYISTQDHTGNYNLVATVGSLKDGVFTPEYKDAKVVVKIAKAKAATLSATGNYTLSLKNQSGAKINYKSGNGWAEFTNLEYDENGVVDKNYAKNAIINGQENHFTDYFEATYENGNMYIALKDLPLTATDPNVPALDKITGNDATAKNNRIGYISINNGYKYIDVKLNITLKDYTTDKTKYKVTVAPVLEGPDAVTPLTILDGKTSVVVEYMMAESTVGFTPVPDMYSYDWYLAAKDLPAGNHKVDLYIIPANAPTAYKNAIEKAATDAEKETAYKTYGVKSSITVKAAAKTTTKKVALVGKGSDKWNVADTDYNVDNATWSTDKSFNLKNMLSIAANSNITIASDADYVTFNMYSNPWMSSEGTGNQREINIPSSYDMQIKLDKTKLATAIAKDAEDTTKAAKNKLNWGKTIKVKATFSYGANGPVDDEVTFSIKLPANAGADDAAVKAALEDENFNKKLQSDIETLTKRYEGYYYEAEEINDIVENYIRSEITKAIKGASVTVEITNDAAGTSTLEGEDEGEEPTPAPEVNVASEWTVTVKSTTEKKEGSETEYKELYKGVFTIPEVKTADDVVTAIGNLSLGGSSVEIEDTDGNLILKVTDKTTGAQFADAVRKLVGVNRNISITAVVVGTPVAPVVGTGGSIAFKLTVKDLSKAPSESGYNSTTNISTISYTIPELDDLDACKNKITDSTKGLNAAKLTEIVQTAYKSVKKTGPDLDAEVKKLIKDEANKLIDNNDDISVDGFAQTGTPAADDFKLETPSSGSATDGTIVFTLHFVDKQTPETTENASDFTLEIGKSPVINLDSIAEFQSLAELVTDAKINEGIDYVETQDAALNAIKALIVKAIVNPAYTESNITVEATTGEAGTEFNKPESSTGSITKVKVSVGAESQTIESVTIKVQTTTTEPTTES